MSALTISPPREQKASLSTPSERHLHEQVCDFLDVALVSAWYTTFPADGASRRGRIGLKLGVPDILIIAAGRAFWIELKASRGKLSVKQLQSHVVLRAV